MVLNRTIWTKSYFDFSSENLYSLAVHDQSSPRYFNMNSNRIVGDRWVAGRIGSSGSSESRRGGWRSAHLRR